MSRSASTEPIINDSMQVIQMDENVSRRPSKQYGGTVPWPPTGDNGFSPDDEFHPVPIQHNNYGKSKRMQSSGQLQS
ncbi:hypothetical protein TCAL_15182 [Tigriopus californicus]|uniref:Uncharacterized protein n=1 Tax=Tigriopus californicus TaxID=6832 RepID=A0A553NDC4_TIGCA|nr:hypothetical protein TCAL_15182 [Tigriopus californicus]